MGQRTLPAGHRSLHIAQPHQQQRQQGLGIGGQIGIALRLGQRQRLARQIRRQPLGATGARGVGSGQQGAAIVGGEQVFSHR